MWVSADGRRTGPSEMCATRRLRRSERKPRGPVRRSRTAPVTLTGARAHPSRSQGSRSVDVRGRAGFPADHQPAAARRPSPLPSCRFPFPVRLQGVPTDACQRVSEPASASPPSLRVRRARRGAEPPEARGPRERGSADLTWPCLPRTRSFEVPSSGVPAAVDSRHTPRRHDTSSRRRAMSLRAMAARPQRPVPSSWFLTTSTAFSAPRGPGLLRPGTGHGVRCVSRPPSDGNRSFQAGGRAAPFPKERESARILAAQTLRRFDPRRQPLRIAAVVASTPFGPPLPHPPRTEAAKPAANGEKPAANDGSEVAAVPTGPRRTRPRGRSLRVRCGGERRLPSLLHTCRVRRPSRDPPGIARGGRRQPAGLARFVCRHTVVPVGLEALLHRRVRDVSSRFRGAASRSFHGFWFPLEATPALVGVRGLPRVRSRHSWSGRSHTGEVSVRGGCRNHRWLPTSGGFRRQRTASTWGRGSIRGRSHPHRSVVGRFRRSGTARPQTAAACARRVPRV